MAKTVSKTKVSVTIHSNANTHLYEELQQLNPRLRARRLLSLAELGLRSDFPNANRPRQTSPVLDSIPADDQRLSIELGQFLASGQG